MTTTKAERTYWDKAASDPGVDKKYIADVNTDECLKAIMPYLKHHKILEIGCGVGRLTSRLATSSQYGCCNLHGIDISKKMVKLAVHHTPWKVYATYKQSDGRTIPDFECNCEFTSIYSMLTFQHLDPETVQGYIKEAYRVLNKDGVFRFQYVEGDYHGDFDHNYKTEDMIKWLQEVGFQVKISEGDRGLIHPQWMWLTATRL
jgi:cyclopropane fatty-acyl-phospholipid synthase-like methyltransferase